MRAFKDRVGAGGGGPIGSAGGDLGGTYPDPTVTSGAHLEANTVPDSALSTAIVPGNSEIGAAFGPGADGGNYGTAFGASANGNTYGTALGNSANGNNGAAVGYSANGSANGAAVGISANGGNNGAAVGYSAHGSDYGAAVGASADGSNGAAVGYGSNGSDGGAAVGVGTNGSSNGAAIGFSANGNNYGAVVGYGADGSNNGAAVGFGATGDGGAAVGAAANGNSLGSALGQSSNGSDHGVAVGTSASAQGLGNVALGGNDGSGPNASVSNEWTDTIELGRGGATLQGGLNFRGVGVVDYNSGSLRFMALDGSALTNILFGGTAQLAGGAVIITTPASSFLVACYATQGLSATIGSLTVFNNGDGTWTVTSSAGALDTSNIYWMGR